MADQAINALSTKTAPETSDQLLLVGTGEPQLIDYDKLADAILNKITSKNYALDAGQMTLLAALNKFWNFVGSSFIKYDDVYIKPSAGIIFIFPNLGGCIQVFFDYNDPSFFKMRKKYSTTWSKWYSYNGTENTL